MSDIVHARVLDHLARLRLGHLADRLDAALSEAARTEPTYLAFLDQILSDEIGAKQRKRVTMGIQIAHFPAVKILDTFEFKFQPSVDERLVRELCTGRFIANGENVLLFGPPGVGKTHLAIAIGRAVIEAGSAVLFTSATALLAALAKAESEGQLAEKLTFYAKPKLLIVDELGYLPFEKRSAHLFFQLVARRYEKGSREPLPRGGAANLASALRMGSPQAAAQAFRSRARASCFCLGRWSATGPPAGKPHAPARAIPRLRGMAALGCKLRRPWRSTAFRNVFCS